MTQPRVVGDRYELGELIGYGGMAEVHRGHDLRLNREVAIKVLRADLARDPSFLARFRREAHSSAGLNHPSIVSVYDTGEDFTPDGTALPFIVMEYVEGRTLRDILRTEERLPPHRAMEITADICAALDFSHRNGIVHRDVKPANVMITPQGAVKVMDFGIARALADTSSTVTQTANVIGTAQYLSPEQARGETVDARSDVYSTGCLLYELITGVPPFQGDSPVAVAYQHVRENPVMPSARNADIPRALDSIVMKALAKNQLNRYQSAGDMRSDLQRALADRPVSAEAVMTDAERTQFIARTPPPVVPVRTGYDQPEEDNSRRTALLWAAVVVALLVVIAVGAYAIVHFGGDNQKAQPVAIPQVVGYLPSQAAQSLKQSGFVPKNGGNTGGPCSGGQSGVDGRVCKLTPDVGTMEKKGSTVTFFTYKKPTVQVPYLIGLQSNAAVHQLMMANLLYKLVPVDSTQPNDTVIAQSPGQAQVVAPQSVVTLKVSNGRVKLADVTGKSYSDASGKLNSDGFTDVQKAGTTVTHNASKDGKVASESPSPGNSYPLSTPIKLTLYKYVKPAPSCTTPPPSPTSSSPGVPGQPTSSAPSSTGSSSSGPPPCTSKTG